jgi:hypothetical protein
MGGNMARGIKKGGKGGKQRGKRRRWAPIRQHNTPPELNLPPHPRSSGAWFVDPHWFKAADRELVRCHERFDRGDRTAVLDALLILAATFPAWLRGATISALMAYRQYTAKTLDEAFGVKRLKGQHHESARNREVLRPQIIFDVYCLHAKGAPLDQAIFEEVGRNLGISGGEASKIFSEPESDELRELVRNLQISN